jgi:hypothetical protein
MTREQRLALVSPLVCPATLQVAAWGITEIIRYSYYAFNTLNGHAPYFLLWLR